MKSIVTASLLVVAALCEVSASQSFGDSGTYVRTVHSSRSLGRLGCTTGAGIQQCADCSTVQICDDTTTLHTIPCPAANPYCSAGACVAERPATCSSESYCKNAVAGDYIPMPTNCSMYAICISPTAAEIYNCPARNVYNATSNNCFGSILARDCQIMRCKTPNEITVHPLYKRYYGLCINSQISQVYSCKANFEYNLATLKCEFACPGVGTYPGDVPAKYYYCYKSGLKLINMEQTCPTGYTFDNDLKRCKK